MINEHKYDFETRGPFLEKSRNFTGHLRVSQFPLYLKNGEGLSLQTSQPFFFCYLENMVKDRLSKQAVGSFTNGFSGRNVFGTFEKQA